MWEPPTPMSHTNIKLSVVKLHEQSFHIVYKIKGQSVLNGQGAFIAKVFSGSCGTHSGEFDTLLSVTFIHRRLRTDALDSAGRRDADSRLNNVSLTFKLFSADEKRCETLTCCGVYFTSTTARTMKLLSASPNFI